MFNLSDSLISQNVDDVRLETAVIG